MNARVKLADNSVRLALGNRSDAASGNRWLEAATNHNQLRDRRLLKRAANDPREAVRK